jgi:hypothetical protein
MKRKYVLINERRMRDVTATVRETLMQGRMSFCIGTGNPLWWK